MLNLDPNNQSPTPILVDGRDLSDRRVLEAERIVAAEYARLSA